MFARTDLTSLPGFIKSRLVGPASCVFSGSWADTGQAHIVNILIQMGRTDGFGTGYNIASLLTVKRREYVVGVPGAGVIFKSTREL